MTIVIKYTIINVMISIIIMFNIDDEPEKLRILLGRFIII